MRRKVNKVIMENVFVGIFTGIITGVITGIFVANLYRKIDKETEEYNFWRHYLFKAMDDGGFHLPVEYLDYYNYIKDNQELVNQISKIMELRGEELVRKNSTVKENELCDCALNALRELEKCKRSRENDLKKVLVFH